MQLTEFYKKYNYHASTKMMQQYLDIKFAHLDCLVLFRMGDFYEMFFEDAILASKVLGIVLTKRGKNDEEVIPMCGVPHHALETYLNKLLEENYQVAICDQLETPHDAKKRDGYKAVVNRNVTRIITPGTIIEESLISPGTPHYLVSVTLVKNKAAICYIDLSTSEISVIDITPDEIINELARLKPKEVLLSENFRGKDLGDNIHKSLLLRISYQVDSFFAVNKCQKIIMDFYKIHDIRAIGGLSDQQISAVGAVLEYLSITQKQNLPLLPLPKIVNYSQQMSIDCSARRNLEITANLSGKVGGSVFGVIDKTVTKCGQRLLYNFLSAPLTNIDHIKERLCITEFFYSNIEMATRLKSILQKTADIERCLTRITMNRSSGRDLLSIKYTLDCVTQIKSTFLSYCGLKCPDYIEKILKFLSENEELYSLIDEAIKEDAPHNVSEGGTIKHEYHPKVTELYDLINNGKLHIEQLKTTYRAETNIENLKISHNNVLGLFIEVTAKNIDKMDDSKFIHRQTTANSVRYTTSELAQLESNLVNARSLVISLEQELYTQICHQITERAMLLRGIAHALSMIDVFCNLAHVAKEYNYTKPELTSDLSFEIIGGRHPVVEQSLLREGKSFVSNDCDLSFEQRIWLITGPNMAGKSTFLRQNAIIAIMAQIGGFVPATKAKIGVVDKIFSRIGSADDLLRGQSTFMVEMLETSAILAQATRNSLIILDEVGRGTSTYDGVSIAWAILEYIHDKLQCRCLFATHYHELTSMSDSSAAVTNYTIAINDSQQDILFLHSLMKGSADKSYGVHVAALAGLPQVVVNRANMMLAKFENAYIEKNGNMHAESSDFNLCSAPPASDSNKKLQALETAINDVDLDQLSPKQALEIIYQLKDINKIF